MPAYEILIVRSAIANLIREGRTTQLTNTITTGRSAGMMLFDHSLEELAQKGVINGQKRMSAR